MLHFESVERGTLDLLKRIQQLPEFADFRLVGGTALALQIGHRTSLDLDLFTSGVYEQDQLLAALESVGTVQLRQQNPVLLQVVIDGIKIDCVHYRYPWIREWIEVEGIRMATLEEIAAMKLAAVSNRGVKRDFFDIWWLIQKFSLKEILGFYQEKFPSSNPLIPLKSLTYFEDAERNEEPVLLVAESWENVKNNIVNEVKKYIKNH